MALALHGAQKIDLDKFELTFEEYFLTANSSILPNGPPKKYWNNDHDYIRQGGFWDPEQITVSDGTLKITTEYKENGKYGPGYYTGMLNTKGLFEQTHGYFEIRCILPKAEGMWSAFWMLCDSMADVTDGGRNGAEIDIYESANYQGLEGAQQRFSCRARGWLRQRPQKRGPGQHACKPPI